ncbi:beta-galactosidase [Actinophytocola oryzae]|uniref:beta-galactosidase n=1 Tax=Actinophytocola oryzae TaxID=502181 RepID=A0A4R7V1H9_9PSEU|nr:beta-galactosidase [Actinophytocola oryzae]TDV43119.1 beta-galactosidase/beta-galactosidase [Actinophytocola oryzae]
MTVLGAQYYRPPNPPRGDWARDLARMKAAGMNTVKLWACWSWIDGREGEYDFADLDELVSLASGNGLRVVVNTIIENAPYWLEHRAPHARYVDEGGRAIRLTAAMNTPGGGWPGLCFDNDEVWSAASAFLRAVASRYDDVVWDVWNEPHLEPASYFPERMYCYCPASLARFTSWLRRKYSTVDALNEAWSRRYSDWAQVAPPRVFEAVPDLLDWREFWFDNLAEWLRRRVEVVREATDATVMTHVALSGFTGQLATHTLDEFRLTDHVDAFGTSSFPTWLMADDHVEHLFNLDAARAAARGIPYWQAELQGGRGRRDGDRSTAQPRPEVVSLWMWNALAAGATGIVFWQWRPELLGPESPGYGLCTPSGDLTERAEAVREFAVVADDPVLAGRSVVEPTVALVVSRRSALHTFATDRTMALYRDAVLGAYRLLLDADVEVRVVHEDDLATGVPTGIETLYWPMPAVADEAVMRTLASFVRAGGRLVAEAGPGEYAPTGHRRPRVPDEAFDGIFGVRERETTVAEPGATIATASGDLRAAWQQELLAPAGADVLGTFAAGDPAITENRVGTGTAVLVATYPSIAYQREPDASSRRIVASLVAPPVHEVRWAEQRPGLLTRRATAADGAGLVFALNWTDAPAALVVPATAKVLHGRVDEGGLVPPMSAALLRVA